MVPARATGGSPEADSIGEIPSTAFSRTATATGVDIGDIGEVVARIFLLLAIDAAVMQAFGGLQCREDFVFAGQFCTVRDFLDILSGSAQHGKDEYHVLRNYYNHKIQEERATHEAWMSRWKNWKVGFSHFEDLPEEPTEDTLWLLLARRAAGVHRRMQSGSDLVIPIFFGGAISCILVQVKNQKKDKEFPSSASTKLHPSFVFTKTNTLSERNPRDMVPVYISLREKASTLMPAQMFMDTTTVRTTGRVMEKLKIDKGLPGYTLCLRGICQPSQDSADRRTAWPFLSSTASRYLEQIANSAYWDLEARVQSDLDRRDNSKFGRQANILSQREVLEILLESKPIEGMRKRKW